MDRLVTSVEKLKYRLHQYREAGEYSLFHSTVDTSTIAYSTVDTKTTCFIVEMIQSQLAL